MHIARSKYNADITMIHRIMISNDTAFTTVSLKINDEPTAN